jgi:flavin reductase (DIM6/NTAB) family NADH-FMN oxidoreductase RutF
MKREVALDQAHRLLAGRPICLLTTRYKGQVNVMTIAWVSPVSLAPPLVALAIHPARYTHDMLLRSEELVLNIPGRALAEQAMQIGSVSGRDEDKLLLTGLALESGHRVEVPWIEECLAHLECAVVDRLAPGDHTLFISEVVGAWVEEEAFDEWWLAPEENEELSPLIHLGGRQFGLFGRQFRVR